MSENVELSKAEEGFVSLKEIHQSISENFEGLTPQFIIAKIPTGSSGFEVSDELMKEIDGVIVDHYAIRCLYLEKYGGGDGKSPNCISNDGLTGNLGQCFSCNYNKWGSYSEFIDAADISKRKACHEKHRIFILRSGEILPIMLSIPPTSIQSFALYMTKLASKKQHYSSVITKLTILRTKNTQGVEYSKVVPTKLSGLSPEKVKESMSVAKYLKTYCRNKPIDDAEMGIKTLETENEKEEF